MKIVALIVILAVLGLLLLVAAVRLLRRRRIFSGILCGLLALLLMALLAVLGLVATNLATYERLTHEEPALKVQFSRTGEHQFDAVLTDPKGAVRRLVLRGDEWQVDARIVKWQAFANIVGFDAAYRLERISGRYGDIASERSAPRTVYPLNPPVRLDIWSLIRRYSSWVPWVDALYGNAVYVPMADGASFDVTVSQSGLVVRPLNDAARQAIGGWR